ncbi:MAG: hypothetical protein JWR84_4019 [Caulobacter sp.]|nr:hypothetical protein [Caulobacter sp.]
MPFLRLIAVIQALSLILGETWRSWGAGRPLVFVVDDYLIGGLLLLGAWFMRTDSLRNRALFAAGWGANAGMIYGSFFGKLIDPASSNPGNFDMGPLTGLLGLAFFVSVAGMIAAIILPQKAPA